jgi:ankyrin repeat protein
MSLHSPAHDSVEFEDLPRLRELLDAGHDVEDDAGDGWSLLHHAIDIEHDSHLQTGEPLRVNVTAFLLARGADPLHRYNGVTVLEDATRRGHWLAAELMRAWIVRGGRGLTETPARKP